MKKFNVWFLHESKWRILEGCPLSFRNRKEAVEIAGGKVSRMNRLWKIRLA